MTQAISIPDHFQSFSVTLDQNEVDRLIEEENADAKSALVNLHRMVMGDMVDAIGSAGFQCKPNYLVDNADGTTTYPFKLHNKFGPKFGPRCSIIRDLLRQIINSTNLLQFAFNEESTA